jgi:hypothetical protein
LNACSNGIKALEPKPFVQVASDYGTDPLIRLSDVLSDLHGLNLRGVDRQLLSDRTLSWRELIQAVDCADGSISALHLDELVSLPSATVNGLASLNAAHEEKPSLDFSFLESHILGPASDHRVTSSSTFLASVLDAECRQQLAWAVASSSRVPLAHRRLLLLATADPALLFSTLPSPGAVAAEVQRRGGMSQPDAATSRSVAFGLFSFGPVVNALARLLIWLQSAHQVPVVRLSLHTASSACCTATARCSRQPPRAPKWGLVQRPLPH